MRCERMEKRAAEPEAEVQRRLSAAEAADAEEDKAFGRDKSGEEPPKRVADKRREDPCGEGRIGGRGESGRGGQGQSRG